MNKIKHSLLWVGMMATSVACVDDYFEANPPLPKDSPYSVLTLEADTLTGGETIPFSIQVVDAPGLIDSIGYTTTDDKGTVTFDQASLDNAIGNTEGVITGQFTAPYNAAGDFTVSFSVFDAQGEQMKSHTMSETFYIKYALEAPVYTLEAADTLLLPGESTELTFDIEAPGGIDDVRIFSNFGQVVLDTASLDAVRGAQSGQVRATYTAPTTPTANVGPVTFTTFVRDQQQERETQQVTDEEAPEVTVEYALPAPSITITGPEVAQQDSLTYIAMIEAPGVISEITVTANVSTRDEEIGEIEISEAALEALVGQTSGELIIPFTVEDFIGYIDLNVTVTDEQGRVTTETYLIRIDP